MSPELLAAAAVIAALLGALAQFRHVRIAERQLRREVNELSEIVARIGEERRERAAGEEKLRRQAVELHAKSLKQSQVSADSVFGSQAFGARLLSRTLTSLTLVVAHCQGLARSGSPELQLRLEELMATVSSQEAAAEALADRMRQVMSGEKDLHSKFPAAYDKATKDWEKLFESLEHSLKGQRPRPESRSDA